MSTRHNDFPPYRLCKIHPPVQMTPVVPFKNLILIGGHTRQMFGCQAGIGKKKSGSSYVNI